MQSLYRREEYWLPWIESCARVAVKNGLQFSRGDREVEEADV
jgi:hypothetical protein